MAEINLLSSLPKSKRSITERKEAKTEDHVKISRMYGKEYFDGDREYGYGGYKYDGRWVSVAKDIKKHFELNDGEKVLDVGCAKGFLVKDFFDLGIQSLGIDISKYAIDNSLLEIKDKLIIGSADKLPFPDDTFDAVVSINTIHNLDREKCKQAINEMQRVSKNKKKLFIQVDSYLNEEQKKIFESWVLTAKFYGYPKEWIELFKECDYEGDWNWTIIN
jgi:ubiquinone/menaquinone biosynthesis C-methylase UbiE|tara:strand:+ start:39 stop:695 length:657 start_codon:yes stop_codon:yes gene_type:complete